MEINVSVAKREFNIKFTEEELAVLIDMGNWNETEIKKHFFMSDYSNDLFKTKEEALKVYNRVWNKLNSAFIGEFDDGGFH